MVNKIIKMLIMSTMVFVAGFTTVSAASYPSQITVSSSGKLDFGGGYYFPVKYLSDGTLGYCTEFTDQFPMNITMSNPKKLESGVAYIIANGFKGTRADIGNQTKMKQYYITQLAIYTYLGQAKPGNSNSVQKAVWDLVNNAKAAANQSTSALNVSLSIPSTTMKLTNDKKYFISEAITVKSNYSNVSFNTAVSSGVGAQLVDANGNAVKTVKSGSVVYIKVPESVINAGQSVTLSMAIKGTRTIKNAYVYQPGQSFYQNIIPGKIYEVKEAAEAKLSVKASKDKITTKVKISKQDITTNKELPGAKLVIKDEAGNIKASWTSGSVPVYVEGLKAGSYTLCETAAPTGYELETQCIKFTVKADGTTSTVVMYNKPKTTTTKVKISKQDITTNKELPGATLVIKDEAGNVKASWTSGTVAKEISGLKPGNYTLCETAAPAGYELYTECIKFTIKADGSTSTVIMYNKPKTTTTKVKVSKQDITTNKELPGAKLEIRDLNGNVKISWTSGTVAKEISGLKEGFYYLCETAAPAGYELETQCVKFQVYANGTTSTVVMYNKPKEEKVTKLSILKVDAETNKALAGATLVLKDLNGKVVKTWTTQTSAKEFTDVAAGNYTLEETKAPAGYVLSTEKVNVTLKEGQTTTVTFKNTKQEQKITKLSILKVDAETNKALAGATLVLKDLNGKVVKTWTTQTSAKEFTDVAAGNYTLEETKAPAGYVLSTEKVNVTLKEGQTTTVTFKNTKQPTKLKISKQDITTNKELPGATLVLKNSKGEVIETWVSTNEQKYFEGLEEGNYTLCETIAPTGYELETECIQFELKQDGNVKTVVMYNTPTPEKETTKVQISKQDITTKEELPGATLVIKNEKGEVVETWVSTSKPKYIEGLEEGNYTLCETIAPSGYELATECVKFTVKNDGKIEKVVIYNSRKETPKNKVKISKQDIATKTELPGATLIIRDKDGNEIKKWVSTNEAFYFELEAGKYTLEEIQAPDGYILSTEKIEFTVNEDGSTDTDIIMYNTREVEVPITASSVSILVYLIGILGMAYGFIKVSANAKLQ